MSTVIEISYVFLLTYVVVYKEEEQQRPFVNKFFQE